MKESIARLVELRDILAGIDDRAKDEAAFGTFQRRRRPYPQLRMIVAYQMRREGYSFLQIGDALSLNHTTIICYEREFEYVLSSTYAPDDWLRELWARFTKAVGDSQPELDGVVDRKTVSDVIAKVYECGYISQRGLQMLRLNLGV